MAGRILPTGCECKYRDSPAVSSYVRKNSRNSGDFWISSLFSVYNRLPPLRIPVYRKKFAAASCELSDVAGTSRKFIPSARIVNETRTPTRIGPASRSVRLVDLYVGRFNWRPYLHRTSGWSWTNRLHRVTRLQRITRAGVRSLLSSVPLLTKLLTMCYYGMDIK